MTATAPTGRPTDSTDADEVVRSPLFALQAREIDNAFELLADDVAYINVSLPTNSRSRPSRAPLQCTREMAAGFRVDFHTVATSGNTALTEPAVAIILGPVEQRIWVYGRFEVTDGKITLWRDSFDCLDVLVGLIRGLAGALIPARNRPWRSAN